jgi:murein DD-endopeptidase MepM/ murein hydrolase activator NlpD
LPIILLASVTAWVSGPDQAADEDAVIEVVSTAPIEDYVEPIGPESDVVSPLIRGEIKRRDSLSIALHRHEVGGVAVDEIVRALDGLFDFRRARPGHRFELLKDGKGRVHWFRYLAGATEIFHAYRDSEGLLRGLTEPVPVQTETVLVTGEVRGSLYLAMERAGHKPSLTMAFIDLFSWDVDFFSETQNGDQFRLIVERRSVDGRPIGYGKILGAEDKRVAGGVHRAFHYLRKDGQDGSSTDSGQAVKKAFLKSPIKFATITSRYGLRRHPILKYKRAHRGVEYAAPRGTAIWALGDGTVSFAGRKGGYGRVVILRHANGLQTRYAHLNGFGKGIRAGKRVSQKQVIGYVGSSGLATGPHLHFEVVKNGRHTNPLRVVVPPAPPIPKGELARYKTAIEPVQQALDEGVLAMLTPTGAVREGPEARPAP